MMMRFFFLPAMLALMSSAHAVQVPTPCGGDARVRCVNYDPYEVVAVKAMFGYSTTIFFSPDEEISDLGGGDTDAWEIGVLERKNGIYIKPKSGLPATNINIVTNKRDYTFDFNVEQLKKAEDRVYKIQFKYPVAEAEKKEVETKKVDLQKELKQAHVEKTKNENYWVEGSAALTPIAAWDDGEFTYLRFAPNTPLPAVYLVEEDGSESQPNKHSPAPYTLAIQQIAKKFVLRRENLVACIYNESFDSYGVEAPSMTVSPYVERVVRDPAAETQKTKPVPSVVRVPEPQPQFELLPPSSVDIAAPFPKSAITPIK